MQTLPELLAQLESKIDAFETTNTAVSTSTIGWQIDHSLKVIIGIINQLKVSELRKLPLRFNFAKTVIFFTKTIPRGKAKAPKSVQSYDKIEKVDLINQIEMARKLIIELEELDNKSNFKHPYFGQLNKIETIKFLKIHTNHHLKIVNDILMK